MLFWAGYLWVGARLLANHLLYSNDPYWRPLVLGLGLCLLFNVVLHTLYGDDLFLYGCNTCFLLLALVAVCLKELPLTPEKHRVVDCGLLAILLLEMACNQRFVAVFLNLHLTVPRPTG